jgi:trehalose synthase
MEVKLEEPGDQLAKLTPVVGQAVIDRMRAKAASLAGKRLVHVNSTAVGGGVAELLSSEVPITAELGLRVRWEVMEGDALFYAATKAFHNAIHGDDVKIEEALFVAYEEGLRKNRDMVNRLLEQADFVIIHDPQPLGLVRYRRMARGFWSWRCHIDASHPHPYVWGYLAGYIRQYDAAIYSLPTFAKAPPPNPWIIHPAIDPLSPKNAELDDTEIVRILEHHAIDPKRPLVTQISRFDRLKDPLGVVAAFQIARKHHPEAQLLLAGGGATDDPEGPKVLAEVLESTAGDPDLHVLVLPPDAHRTINAFQRASTVLVQKSVREGFGLTVTEGMYKGKPVVAGRTGGIVTQIEDEKSGYLVSSVGECGTRIAQLLDDPAMGRAMGATARQRVIDHFLVTRKVEDFLDLCTALSAVGVRYVD